MAEVPKNYCVVTVTPDSTVHAYGPYTQGEAYRLANRYEFNSNGAMAFPRKLLGKNETNVKPHTPKG